MTTTMVIFCCVVAVLVGFGLAFLFRPKNNNQLPAPDSKHQLSEAKAEVLQKQLDALNKEKSYLQTKLANLESKGNATQSIAQQEQIDSLNKEKADLQKKLSQLESENKDLDKRLQNAQQGKVDASASDEIKKLKKKISDLEEEKDDLEEDFNDKLKKEKRKLEEQKKQIEDDLRKSKKDLEAVNEQVQTLSVDLKDAERSAELKKESLAFVKEVLTAKATQSGSQMSKLYDVIDDIQDIILEQLYPWVLECLRRPEDSNENLHDHEKDYFFGALDWAATSRKKWIANKTAIAFVGEFSAGKTTIVNVVLAQGDSKAAKLPVSMKATTAIPTYITGGNTEKFQFVSPDNVLKQMSPKTFMKINKEVLGEVDGVSAMLKYFVMEYKNSNLNNLSILDTPGFNSNDSEDAQRTIDVINECDALFWVFDVNAGTVNKSSIKVIKEHLEKPLYVVINKVDTKSDKDVQQVENLIQRTFQNEGITVKKIIRFFGPDSQEEESYEEYWKNPKAQKCFNELMNTIKSVPRSNDTSGYLKDVQEWVNDLVGLCNQACQESISKCDASDKRVDELFNNISNIVDNITDDCADCKNDCEAASDYGTYEEKWFRDDVIEFSKSEYNSLQYKLKAICNKQYAISNGVINLWNENFLPYKKAVIEMLSLYDDKGTNESRNKRITEIQENLKKKIKEFNELK